VSSWESKEFDWQYREHVAPKWDDSDEEFDEDLTAEQAGEILFDYLISLLQGGTKTNAKMVCCIAWWASLAGVQGRVTSLALKPESASRNFSKHVDRCTRLADDAGSLYELDMPGHSRFDVTHSVLTMPVTPAHELLHSEFVEVVGLAGTLERMKADNKLPPLYYDHPVVLNHRDESAPIFPLALYMDGVATTNKEAVLAVTIQNLCTGRRHLLGLFRKSRMCRCGCRTWCSLWSLMHWLHWQCSALEQGCFPSQRHDGSDWKTSDELRRSFSGSALGFRGAICQVRGDWAEFSKTWGFASWQTNANPCLFCECTSDDMLSQLRSANALELPWTLRNMAGYDLCCRGTEVRVTLSAEQGRRVLHALYYDRRKIGSRGRCLLVDLPELGLQKDDRLEPSLAIPFPSQFDLHDRWPVVAVIWRTSAEKWAKHRNPLLDSALGITLDVICVDNLHTMALGIYKNFVTFALWACIKHDVYEVGAMYSDAEKDEIGSLRMAAELHQFYIQFKRAHGGSALSEIGDFCLKTLGSRASPSLHAKAAETEGLLSFCVVLLQKYSALMPSGGHWLAAATALDNFKLLLSTSKHNPTAREAQDS
jgi:hypothetical protein